MSQSRSAFLESYNALLLASKNPATFDNPSDVDHDTCAKLFRRSMAVSLFSTLETFIRSRTSEILAAIDHRQINFELLPLGIQEAATVGAINALNFRLKMIESTLKQGFVISEAANIASIGTTSFRLSELSFGQDKSNLNSADIAHILDSFQIDSAWNKIKIIATSIGLGGALSYEEAFKNIAQRRHLAAHTTNAQISGSDISDSLPLVFAIAISFDLILSRCGYFIKEKDSSYLRGLPKKFSLDPNSIPFAKIERGNGKWSLKKFKGKKAIFSDVDLSAVYQTGIQYSHQNKCALIEFGANKQPTRWHC